MYVWLYLNQIQQYRIQGSNKSESMPTVFQFLQNPQLFPYESTLTDNPDILNSLIDYISKNPDPLLQNQQQCYSYPNRSSQILSLGTTYRTLIVKKQRKNKKTAEKQNYYPYLDRMFKNLEDGVNTKLEDTLIGYVNKVLISLAKKTPQIYQYVKDNQNIVNLIVKNNVYLRSLKQFLITFLIQSTMGLYVFLKNVVIRALMFRIIDQKDTDNIIAYEVIYCLYQQISRKQKQKLIPQDQKQELQAISVNFHDLDFITLLILKVSCKNHQRSFLIGKMLNQMILSPNGSTLFVELSLSHLEAMEEFFQSYEDCEQFMDHLSGSQLQILAFLANMSNLNILEFQQEANLLKRLLVYSGIHNKNSILHNLLIKVIESITKNKKTQIFKSVSVIPFLMKNWQDGKASNGGRFLFGGLVWRVCVYWTDHESKLSNYLTEEQKLFVKLRVQQKKKLFQNVSMYKVPQLPKEQLTTEYEQSQQSLPVLSKLEEPNKQTKQAEEPSKTESDQSQQK